MAKFQLVRSNDKFFGLSTICGEEKHVERKKEEEVFLPMCKAIEGICLSQTEKTRLMLEDQCYDSIV